MEQTALLQEGDDCLGEQLALSGPWLEDQETVGGLGVRRDALKAKGILRLFLYLIVSRASQPERSPEWGAYAAL
jgi:hypothetical protein